MRRSAPTDEAKSLLAQPQWIMRVVPFLSIAARRRCRRLAAGASEILLARRGARAHSHVLWLGLVGVVSLFAQIDDLRWYIIPSLALVSGLGAIVLFDVKYFLIPDGPIAFLFVLGVATVLAGEPREAPARLVAAIGAWLFFRVVAWTYERWRGFAGLGFGDAKLFAIAGLWLGFQELPGCLLVAAGSGMLSAMIALRERGLADARHPIPFGPHLALGIWLAWAVGPLEAGPDLQ